ncbi:MAG: ParB/RepB/Spo0J family partition protein, partial [Thermodesulfovibrionales bacterium]
MSVRSIQTDDILIDESRFNLKKALFGIEESDSSLTRSLEEFGILSPVTVFRDRSGGLHLIDGYRRVRFAIDSGLSAVEAVVLPDPTVVEEIISMVLYDKRSIITESVMNKICFVTFAVSLEAREEWILKDLCKALALKPHRSMLEECERMSALQQELKSFCHEKKFSLKQILNLSHHPGDLLMQLMSWRQVLSLTASVLDEIASNLKDYLRSNDIDIKVFVSDAEVEAVIDSDLSPRDRTDRLRKLISARRYPVLSEVNKRIERAVRRMGLPGGVVVSWDRTLENKGVNIDINIKGPDEWDSV